MYSTSSGRGFLPLVTAAHEISPTCSCMRNPGEEECMIHIRGHVLSNGLDLMGTGVSPRLDPKFKANIDSMMELADKAKLTQREEKHVNAMKKLADGSGILSF